MPEFTDSQVTWLQEKLKSISKARQEIQRQADILRQELDGLSDGMEIMRMQIQKNTEVQSEPKSE